MQNAEHDFQLMTQKIESTEKALKEARDALNSESSKNKISLDSLNDQINKERKELQIKLDNTINDLNIKEKRIHSFRIKKGSIGKNNL